MVNECAAVGVSRTTNLASVVIHKEPRQIGHGLPREALMIFQSPNDRIGCAGADNALVLDR